MDMDINTPPQMASYVASLPPKYVGTLYAKVKPPFSPFGFWYRVPAWGQLADGGDHRNYVENMLYNDFPFRGRGWTYIEWRNEPASPEINDAPRTGKVRDPKPYSGALDW